MRKDRNIPRPWTRRLNYDWIKGLGYTLVIALLAKYASYIQGLQIIGPLVIALLLGFAWRAALGIKTTVLAGASFSSKTLLRFGIVLLGMRLNWEDILQAGTGALFIAFIVIPFTLMIVYLLARLFKVGQRISLLTACGTAICGAAAVIAIAPQIKAKNEEVAVSVAVVAILGTGFTLLYTLLYPSLGLTAEQYGIFAGATLHEIAHVIAASAPAGETGTDIAVVIKLTRVALLVPVAILMSMRFNRSAQREAKEGANWRSLSIPWFIIGFLLVSGIQATGLIPAELAAHIVSLAYILIAMAMAGLGLSVEMKAIQRLGLPPLIAGLIGSVFLSLLGYSLVIFL